MAPKKKKTEKDEKSSDEEEEKEKSERLHESLEDIKTREGIIGYILRTSDAASIDVKDPTKIIDYAVLSSTALEVGEELSETFELGEPKSVLLHGKDAKILSLRVDDQRLSVFMEKDVDHEEIYEDLDL
jgi:predicted regulator of Ras-like GTPase activity (Roadblock/LC7/MglB family)